jgi:hypothetical protein
MKRKINEISPDSKVRQDRVSHREVTKILQDNGFTDYTLLFETREAILQAFEQGISDDDPLLVCRLMDQLGNVCTVYCSTLFGL